MNEPLVCECGCGETIPWKPAYKYRRPRFLPGHWCRGKPQHVYVPQPEEIPSGVCECGCGQPTAIARLTVRSRRWFRGHPLPFLPGHSRQKRGPESPRWTGGRSLGPGGYVYVHAPDHPAGQRRKGYVAEHRLVMEAHLGRRLEPGEVVHHLNHDKTDNRLENLMLFGSNGEHRQAVHHREAPRTLSPEARERIREGGRRGAAARWGSSSPA